MRGNFVEVYPGTKYAGKRVRVKVLMNDEVLDFYLSLHVDVKAKISAIYEEIAERGILPIVEKFSKPYGTKCDHLRDMKIKDHINRHYIRIFCILNAGILWMFDYEFKKQNSFSQDLYKEKCKKAKLLGIES